MCGLVGYIDPRKKLTLKEKENYVTSSLFVDTIRGRDSTGIALCNAKQYTIKKEIDPGTSREAQRWTKAAVFQNNSDLFIGHNRAGTVGGKTKTEAHPFDTGRLVGAHNGTLHHSWSGLVKKTFSTDSESLYNDINEYGFRETIAKIPGAMALTWFDKKDKTVSLFRNSERDLWLAQGENGVWFWASELRFIAYACMSAGLTYKNEFLLEVGTLHTISLDPTKKMKVVKDIEIAKKPIIPRTNYNSNWNKRSNRVHGVDGEFIQGVWHPYDDERYWYDMFPQSYYGNHTEEVKSDEEKRRRQRSNQGLFPKASGDNIKDTNTRLALLGSSKKHGDNIILKPQSSTGQRLKKYLRCSHSWVNDSDIRKKDDLDVILSPMAKDLIIPILAERFLIIGKITNCSKKGNVHVASSNLELVNVSGDTFNKSFNDFVTKLLTHPDFLQHFKRPPLLPTAKSFVKKLLTEAGNKVTMLPPPVEKKHLCTQCNGVIPEERSYYQENSDKKVHLHVTCVDKYIKGTTKQFRHFTFINVSSRTQH